MSGRIVRSEAKASLADGSLSLADGSAPQTGKWRRFHSFDRLIIAACGDDMPFGAVYGWLRPLLEGLGKPHWSVCLVEFESDRTVKGWFVDGSTSHEHLLQTKWGEQEWLEFWLRVPPASELLIVMVDNGFSQVSCLMEEVCDWLCLYEPGEPEFKALNRLFSAFNVLIEE